MTSTTMTMAPARGPVATCRKVALGPLRFRLYMTPEVGTRFVGAFVTRGDSPEAREETALAVDFYSDHLARVRAEKNVTLPTADDSGGVTHNALTGEWGGKEYTIPASTLAAIANYDSRNAEIARLRRSGDLD